MDRHRLRAAQDRLAAQMDLGQHAEVVDELQTLVEENPLHESLRAKLMKALDRSGRRAEALQAYRAGRDLLVAELGIEPGPELREAQATILAGDRAAAAPGVPAAVVPARHQPTWPHSRDAIPSSPS